MAAPLGGVALAPEVRRDQRLFEFIVRRAFQFG
jgi:hypothetical protein